MSRLGIRRAKAIYGRRWLQANWHSTEQDERRWIKTVTWLGPTDSAKRVRTPEAPAQPARRSSRQRQPTRKAAPPSSDAEGEFSALGVQNEVEEVSSGLSAPEDEPEITAREPVSKKRAFATKAKAARAPTVPAEIEVKVTAAVALISAPFLGPKQAKLSDTSTSRSVFLETPASEGDFGVSATVTLGETFGPSKINRLVAVALAKNGLTGRATAKFAFSQAVVGYRPERGPSVIELELLLELLLEPNDFDPADLYGEVPGKDIVETSASEGDGAVAVARWRAVKLVNNGAVTGRREAVVNLSFP
ncbi:hypothetical protein GGTG_13296 [Gaeumannomyces tritici R3-111a-1]|uniref:Uncharacterized protein n=1 Tax=Gaeumannomyces tritici (strain R3-111a-1) TaxID=644352 RepID=J3PIG8_GAET3|nr:hypothetical protein GGTG_13296 [Gaeumannomyces tritici R3-111a-1]EJT69187.1 hypothetical protein GGTG_13296 [Gaeumannomyces tritici R3-111a-1]